MGIREKLTGLLSLPREIALNLPLIIITGRDEVNIENYKGIKEYTDDRVTVNTSAGMLLVEGRKLKLRQITDENVIVSGVITALQYTGE
ncbi:MAG: YabP/YqfC family sporulation protein [Clostridiales bacterium]|nr:YabP/YqfC family sporulation protein [Clostridiales bacterium]